MMMVAAMYNDDKEEEVTLRVSDFLALCENQISISGMQSV